MKYLLGYDIGSSSVKASLLQAESGSVAANAFSPAAEMEILSVIPGFAEQDPERWWSALVDVTAAIRQQVAFQPDEIIAIGVSYQMHGLVCVDRALRPVRPAIIWCDSRAVTVGDKAFKELGETYCLAHFLNSPGNFTASKLKWVQENEPAVYDRIYKIMLPGDYIALKLTGSAQTTISGLSEGIFWDYLASAVSKRLLEFYQIDEALLAPIVPTFGEQGKLCSQAADTLGIRQNTPISYRAGDQPNNAFALNVLNPGEIAATAGTSGVIYGVTDLPVYDLPSRVNTFVHVNHSEVDKRYGVLLCVNGTGILNSWIRKNFFPGRTYDEINHQAAAIAVGAEGLQFFPFGNGSERMLNNKNVTARLKGLQFNTHHSGHLARAAQEGIVFALNYGMEIMKEMKLELKKIRAGHANMFLSDVFAQTFADVSGCTIELYDTDGAQGAARAAGIGAGYYKNFAESHAGMRSVKKIDPDLSSLQMARDAYFDWKTQLTSFIQ